MSTATTTKFYDYNLWSQDPGKLCLSAYELAYSTNNTVQTGSKWHTLELNFPEDLIEIEYLLGDIAINYLPFTDYDTWIDPPMPNLFDKEVPEKIALFVAGLPEYEMEQN